MQGDDAAVVAQVLSGDRDAFSVLVERHSRLVFRTAFRMTGNEQDADEVVQDTFLKAYRNLTRFESRASFSTWVYRIGVNCALDLVGRRQPGHTVQISEDPEPGEQEMQIESERPGPERLAFSREIQTKIARAMKTLTPTEKAAFVMRHTEGKSVEEIAAALGIKAGATKNTIFRAVQKMRRTLEPLMAPSAR